MTEIALVKKEYERGVADGRHSVAVDTMVRLHFLMGMPITEAADLIPCGADQRPALIQEAEKSCTLQPLQRSNGTEKHLVWSQFVASRIMCNETAADLMSPAIYDWCIDQMQEYLVELLSQLQCLLGKHNDSSYEVIEQEKLSWIQRCVIVSAAGVFFRRPELSMEQIAKELISGVIGYELLPELATHQFAGRSIHQEDAYHRGVSYGAMDMAVLTTHRISHKLGLSLEDASGLVGCRYRNREEIAIEAEESCLLQDPAMLEEHNDREREMIISRRGMNDITSVLLTQNLAHYLIDYLLGYCGMLVNLVADKAIAPEALHRFVKDADIAGFFLRTAELCTAQEKTNSTPLLLRVFSALVGYDIGWYFY